jgi:hypothetical protein
MSDALIATGQMREDAPARWVGQRGKRAVQSLWRIFNHLVKYITASFALRKQKIFVYADFPTLPKARLKNWN